MLGLLLGIVTCILYFTISYIAENYELCEFCKKIYRKNGYKRICRSCYQKGLKLRKKLNLNNLSVREVLKQFYKEKQKIVL